jgi:hypothetical protein
MYFKNAYFIMLTYIKTKVYMTSQTSHVRCRQVDKTTQQYVSREVAKQANKSSWFLNVDKSKKN